MLEGAEFYSSKTTKRTLGIYEARAGEGKRKGKYIGTRVLQYN